MLAPHRHAHWRAFRSVVLLLHGPLILFALGGCKSTADPAPPAPAGRVVFQSTPTGGVGRIVIMNADGSGRQTLLSGAADYRDPALSPDGARIALSSNADGDYDLYVMNVDGTGLTQITGVGAPDTTDDFQPAWSPDGTQLAFKRAFASGQQLIATHLDGTHAIPLTPITMATYLEWPAWSPDGSRIAFIEGGTPTIWFVNPDGSGLAPLAGSLAGDTAMAVAWSPDGTRLALTSTQGLQLVDPDGSNASPSIEPAGSIGVGSNVAWSPDGTQLVYVRNAYPSPPRIGRVNVDGTGQVDLTKDTGESATRPTWAP